MLDPVTNFGKATVTGFNAVATSATVDTGQGARFPQPSTDGAFNVTVWNATDYADPSDDPDREIVRVTARSGDVMTITRAQEGTSASAHNTAGKTYKIALAITEKMIADIRAALNAIAPITFSLVDITGTFDDSNLIFTLASEPENGVALVLLARQPQFPDLDFVYDGVVTLTFVTPPPSSLSGEPFKALVY